MQNRVYTFLVGVQQAAAPDAGVASSPSDLLAYGNPVEQEVVAGTKDNVNTAFTIANLPRTDWPFSLYVDGTKQIYTTHYTRAGMAITIPGGIGPNQVVTADYRY